MKPLPGCPLDAVYLNWHNAGHDPTTPFATANGDNIGSNTPEGVLRRLETWIRKNDIGGGPVAGEGKNVPVVVEVKGQKAIVLTPIHRRAFHNSADWGEVIQNFDVKLWWQGKEYESLNFDFRTVVWSCEKSVRKKRS